MCAVLMLGICVVYRSTQCNLGPDPPLNIHSHPRHEDNWSDYLTYLPSSFGDFANAFPIFVSCFICHYNVPPVYNELRNPTPKRANWVVRSTVWSAGIFYLVVGFAGSMYGNCTASGKVQGNVLLDFDENDTLLLVGRTCLAGTVSLALPLLVIPSRDIALKVWGMYCQKDRIDAPRGFCQRFRKRFNAMIWGKSHMPPPSEAFPPSLDANAGFEDVEGDIVFEDVTTPLSEPLLTERERDGTDGDGCRGRVEENENEDIANNRSNKPVRQGLSQSSLPKASRKARTIAAVAIFWSAASLACLVKSIDIVWDLLGSSLSICLGFLIPCGSYLVLYPGNAAGSQEPREGEEEGVVIAFQVETPVDEREDSKGPYWERVVAKVVLGLFIPTMVICTVNAFYCTFFKVHH